MVGRAKFALAPAGVSDKDITRAISSMFSTRLEKGRSTCEELADKLTGGADASELDFVAEGTIAAL